MHSFLFPEDLDPAPLHTTICEAPRSKKLQDAFPVPSTRRRPVPIILPPTFKYDAIEYKSKDEVVVSVARFSLDERSPRLEKTQDKRSALTRWKSATLAKSDKQDRNARMALAEAERTTHAVAKADRSLRPPRKSRGPLRTLAEDYEREGQRSPVDFGVHHAVF